MKKIQLALLLAITAQLSTTHAASIVFDQSLFGVKDAAGVQLTNSTDNLVAIGYFTDGFTATTSNYASWLSNFKGVTGYHKLATGVQSGGLGFNTVSAAITVAPTPGPLHDADFGPNDYLATVASSQGGSLIGGLAVGDVLPENKSFSLIIWNSAASSTATQAGVYIGTSAWQIGTTNPFDVAEPNLVDFALPAASFTAGVGAASTVSGNRFFQLTAIPEPSSASLLALGVAGLVALRIRRKS
jgi:hypothetical protein